MIVKKLQPGLLRVSKSRARAALQVLLFAASLLYCFWRTVGASHTDLWEQAFLAIVVLVFARDMLGELKVAVRGDSFLFDAQRRTIERNHQMIASFDDIERVQIRTYSDWDGVLQHRLSLVFRNGQKMMLGDRAKNWKQILGAAYAVARTVGVEVSKKGDESGRFPLNIELGS